MSVHPLCHTLWLITQTIERHGAHRAWLACGGRLLVHAGMTDPQGAREVRHVSVNHPAPIRADIEAQDDLVGLVRALLILEGWAWRGSFGVGGLGGITSLSPVPMALSAHHMLPIWGRMDGHMARLGWIGTWTDALRDRLDNIAAFGAVAADPTFSPDTYRAANLAV